MKKIIITVSLAALTLTSFGQLTMNKSPRRETIGKIISVECYKSNDQYHFIYRDVKFTTIVNYKDFTMSKEEFDAFYFIIANGLENKITGKYELETEKDFFILNFKNSFGAYVEITHFANKSANVAGRVKALFRKPTYKLFGKIQRIK